MKTWSLVTTAGITLMFCALELQAACAFWVPCRNASITVLQCRHDEGASNGRKEFLEELRSDIATNRSALPPSYLNEAIKQHEKYPYVYQLVVRVERARAARCEAEVQWPWPSRFGYSYLNGIRAHVADSLGSSRILMYLGESANACSKLFEAKHVRLSMNESWCEWPDELPSKHTKVPFANIDAILDPKIAD